MGIDFFRVLLGALLLAVCDRLLATTSLVEVNYQDGRRGRTPHLALSRSKTFKVGGASRLAAPEKTIDQRGETFLPLVTIVPEGGHIVCQHVTTHQFIPFRPQAVRDTLPL